MIVISNPLQYLKAYAKGFVLYSSFFREVSEYRIAVKTFPFRLFFAAVSFQSPRVCVIIFVPEEFVR